ncbi:MAG: hypothetical protein CMI96_03450 [Pelagibacteraceae bacterium]|nr:hypothetical protein [Pelagibacteraceae bacterium]PPR47299.1 MAG: Bifunctional protein HldE [Alphaproteobacteria bacterium MarineAlpha5_Bin9]|tara:strand:+ start:4227 stop:4673 length:447 start_codon:yes stop_codon:yes gene_type:complete
MDNLVLVSGGFDPLHSGHIALINEAAKHGEVIVLLNSDNWLRNKKGKEFLSFKERKIIMNSIKKVIDVIGFDDTDKTCIDGIKKTIKKYPDRVIKFANGGDRNNNTTPEVTFCLKNNVENLWGIGGDFKMNSSSWILENWTKIKGKVS